MHHCVILYTPNLEPRAEVLVGEREVTLLRKTT